MRDQRPASRSALADAYEDGPKGSQQDRSVPTELVMPGQKRGFAPDVAGIHVLLECRKTWMPGTSPGMTSQLENSNFTSEF
jgi:hypothetical protein